jgi:hypothetical protein
MSKTQTGLQAFKDMIATETKINISITNDILKNSNNEVHGLTEPVEGSGFTKSGLYEEVNMKISTADVSNSNDRFNGYSREEKLNAIGTHESVHLSKNQINRDYQTPTTEKYREQMPVMLELKTRMEYHKSYGNSTGRNIIGNYENYLSKKNFKKVMQSF